MSRFKRGQIWLVNFDPGIGHEYKKTRPALIVQKDRYIDDQALLTVIPISSQIDKPGELDIAMAKDAENRLMKDSLLKVRQISSFDQRRFVKRIGTIDKDKMAVVKGHVRRYLL